MSATCTKCGREGPIVYDGTPMSPVCCFTCWMDMEKNDGVMICPNKTPFIEKKRVESISPDDWITVRGGSQAR